MNTKTYRKKTCQAVAAVCLVAAVTLLAACRDRADDDPMTPRRVDELPGASVPVSEQVRDQAKDARQAVANASDDLQSSAARTWADMRNATFDQRREFSQNLESLSSRIDDKMADWRARSSSLSGEARAAWDRGVAELSEARQNLAGELRKLSDATADNWESAKANVSRAWERVEAAYRDLERRMAE